MKLSYSERKRGWYVSDETTIPCAIAGDGLLVKFNRQDVIKLLNDSYPHTNTVERVWWFNSSKDRICAETDGEFVYANPQVMWQHFMKKR